MKTNTFSTADLQLIYRVLNEAVRRRAEEGIDAPVPQMIEAVFQAAKAGERHDHGLLEAALGATIRRPGQRRADNRKPVASSISARRPRKIAA